MKWTKDKALKEAQKLLGPKAYVDRAKLEDGLTEGEVVVCIIGVMDTSKWPPVPQVFYSASNWALAVHKMQSEVGKTIAESN